MEKSRRIATVKRPRSGMAVILRNVPRGYDWGWFSREDPRMHLQVVDREHLRLHYKVWLEEKGQRVFEAAARIPEKILKKIEEQVAENRDLIEDQWTRFMIDKKWLALALDGSLITLTAYPVFAGSRFQRTLDLADEFPGLYDPSPQVRTRGPVKPDELILSSEMNAIEIRPRLHESERHHIYLPPILWRD